MLNCCGMSYMKSLPLYTIIFGNLGTLPTDIDTDIET